MRFSYPAVLQPQPDGSYTGYFPDLEQCTFHGRTLMEALDAARDAEDVWLSLELSESMGLPPRTYSEDMTLAPGEFMREIAVILRLTDGYDE